MNTPRTFSLFIGIVGAAAVSCITGSNTQAAELTYTGGTGANPGTNWNFGGNWSGGGVPTNLDDVMALGPLTSTSKPSSINITLPGAFEVNNFNVTVNSGDVTNTWGFLNASANASSLTVRGSMTKGGTGTVAFRNNGGGNTLAVRIDQNLLVNGGVLEMGNSTTAINSLSVSGTTRLDGGTLNVVSADAALGHLVVNSGALNVYNRSSGAGGVSASSLSNSSATGIVQASQSAGVSGTLTLTGNSGTFSYGGQVRNNGSNNSTMSLAKTGANTQILTGLNSYTGATTISAGTLIINGSLGNTAVSIASGAVFSGTGSVAGAVAVDGMITAGASAGGDTGTLTISNSLTLHSTATTHFELRGTAAGEFDRIVLTGVGSDLILNGVVTVSLLNGYDPLVGARFDLFDWTGELEASAFDINSDLLPFLPSLAGGKTWDTSSFLVDGSLAVVPEPGVTVLLAIALGVVVFFQKRQSA